jgi:hypothetical protein
VAAVATAASMFVAQHAQAASQIAEVAAGDNRIGTIGLLFVPALGWVGFNMLTPLQNQARRGLLTHLAIVRSAPRCRQTALLQSRWFLTLPSCHHAAGKDG